MLKLVQPPNPNPLPGPQLVKQSSRDTTVFCGLPLVVLHEARCVGVLWRPSGSLSGWRLRDSMTDVFLFLSITCFFSYLSEHPAVFTLTNANCLLFSSDVTRQLLEQKTVQEETVSSSEARVHFTAILLPPLMLSHTFKKQGQTFSLLNN